MNKRAALLNHVPGPKAAFYAIMVKGNHGINLHRLVYLGGMVTRKRKKKERKKLTKHYPMFDYIVRFTNLLKNLKS